MEVHTCRPLLLSKNTKQVFGRDQKGRHHQAKKKLLIFHRNGSFTLLFMPMNFFWVEEDEKIWCENNLTLYHEQHR